MSTLAPLIEAWDEAHREFAIALEGLSDEDLWKRPHPRLLSVGELAGHVAYWQGVWVTGGGNDHPDLDRLPIKSLLLNDGFRYYTSQVGHPFSVELGTAEILAEVMRVHEAAKAVVAGFAKEDPYPGQWGTWGNLVQYQAFHVAYHTGQAYSVRHLLGHETEDN
ncbi:MAG TPA: DinB family protein [Fimbriimonadaceae bacterium]|nr:DinB family protein [Fimbriimonadaceae bacterium]